MHSKNFKTTLKEIEHSGKKAYELTVENLVKKAGRYNDQIMIITDQNGSMPLKISVAGYIDAIQPKTEKPVSAPKPETAVKIKPRKGSTPLKMNITPPAKPEKSQPSEPVSAPEPTSDGNAS
jgi:hypothetical protein